MSFDYREMKSLHRLITYTHDEAEKSGDMVAAKLLALASHKLEKLIQQYDSSQQVDDQYYDKNIKSGDRNEPTS